ncbi:biotin--protein ligase [Synchiropus splendidus]|uniref:biotin--protein ligase n=1 Tax=Synchiropus splendidus TaxID=270530 RepID=UPI00237EBA6C|nr:biotin--protein ligase [Synchiropus splendidus]
MLITLCYVYLWVRFHKCYSALIRHRLSRLKGSRRSLSFGLSPGPSSVPALVPGAPSSSSSPLEDRVFLQLGDKSVYVTEPQVCDDLNKWTLMLGSSMVGGPQMDLISFIIEATGQAVGYPKPPTTKKKVLNWSDCCLPLACSPGRPFRAVAQASVENFSRLGVAFIENRLQLDKGLMPSKIVPVLLQQSTLSRLLEKLPLQVPKITATFPQLTEKAVSCHTLSDHQLLQLPTGSPLFSAKHRKQLEERRRSDPVQKSQDQAHVSDSEDHSVGSHHHTDADGRHLHLSSCHECLELENSTILSVKYASAENIPDLPNDGSERLDSEDEALDDLVDDAEVTNCTQNNKVPNVLVYTGGCQERFERVQQVLRECINMENYIIYPLLPKQVLTDPWLDSTRLLVLAEEEPLTPNFQTRILTYLSQGGRVLGLASSLCPAGLSLEPRERQRGQVCRLSFTREDNSQLDMNVLASGRVYIRAAREGGEVELWGELRGASAHQRDMVIVRVTHGPDGGEAVVCQVHLETNPDALTLTKESFNQLKVSNHLRYEILREILTSLGLSCHQNQPPEPSPLHVLATSTKLKSNFLTWLKTHADLSGLLKLPKASLRLTTHCKLEKDPSLSDGSLPLFTDSSESQVSENFSLEIYRRNLKTRQLGQTVLYADVVSSTMELFEGLYHQLPKDISLIVVAAQQISGRGRGRNAWLSPLGCAMFTLCLQVDLKSKLGQRIPFLQHLVALSVIEAVRTLPGYEDVDLRLKWPNDIYYSNLVKLGGVLVTSTVMGSTFHMLIGCGFNVSNSNPTACINDLIEQHNAENKCNLQPLNCSQLIARTVTCLEALISTFQRDGPDGVLPTYYKRWLHSGTQVRLWSEDGQEANVVGLDHNGYLQVHNEKDGLVSVEPDGNSFDMLKNLVTVKRS